MNPGRTLMVGIVLIQIAAALIALMARWGLQPLIPILP